MVESAPTFPDVILKLRKWMKGEGLIDEDDQIVEECCWCTDGVRVGTAEGNSRPLISDALHFSPGIFEILSVPGIIIPSTSSAHHTNVPTSDSKAAPHHTPLSTLPPQPLPSLPASAVHQRQGGGAPRP